MSQRLALLFTIVVIFTLQGQAIVASPMDVVVIALPLMLYFSGMFLIIFYLAYKVGTDYSRATSQE